MKLKDLWVEKRLSFWLILILIVLSLFVWVQVVTASEKQFSIKFYDVGQGDSIFIQTPAGYKILVDGGPNNRVSDYLNIDLGLKDRSLDLVILTHPQEDHLKGLVEVINRFSVKKVLTTKAFHTTASFKLWQSSLKNKNIPVEYVGAGSSVTLSDGVTLSFVWPEKQLETLEDLNDASLVFKVSYGEFDALLTGDADTRVQPYTGTIGDIELLKVPHHGSKTGLKEDFLNSLKPEIAVLSLGKNNRYGHPGENILEMLKGVGATVFRTDQDGVIEIVSDSQTWYTRTQH